MPETKFTVLYLGRYDPDVQGMEEDKDKIQFGNVPPITSFYHKLRREESSIKNVYASLVCDPVTKETLTAALAEAKEAFEKKKGAVLYIH